jgi:hypothetical protein
VAVGDVGGFNVAADGLLVTRSHCRVVNRNVRLLGGGSFCGAGRVVCGDVLGCIEAGCCLCGVARLRIGGASGCGGVA